MNLKQIFQELKRRNVFRVAGVYAITAWLLIQIIATVFPILQLPEWSVTLLTVIILIGFPLALIFAWAFEITPDGIKPTVQVNKDESIASKTGKKINKLTIYALSIFILFLLTERIFFAESRIIDRQEKSVESVASIAVLPFVNMSGDEENEYFSDGLSEELLNALAKVEDMKVAGRTSSFKFKGRNENLKEIGAELGVDHILEGSVRKAGDRVRITAQLISVEDGYHLWSETYDRELTDIFAIQEEISNQVLTELQVRLIPEDKQELETIPTSDIEAYQLFLKANQLVINRNYDEIVAAIDLYENAIRLDPGFAEAHARLAIAYNLKAYYGNVPFDEAQRQLKQTAERALNLNENSSFGHAALGTYHENEQEFEEAERQFKRAIELNPNNADFYNWLGNLYEDMDQPAKQFETYTKGYEVDPLNPLAIYNRTRVSSYNEDYEEMEEFVQKNIRINPDFIPTYYLQGNTLVNPPFVQISDGFEYLYKVYELDPNFPRAMQGMAYIGIDLDIEPLAEYFYRRLEENYSESLEYRLLVGSYSWYKEDLSIYEELILEYLDEMSFTPRGEGFYFGLKNYALATGNHERALEFYRAYDPALFNNDNYEINEENLGVVQSLAELLKFVGETEKSRQLNELACQYGYENHDLLKDGKEDAQYYWNDLSCKFNEGRFEEILPILTRLYNEKRLINGVANTLEDIERFYPEAYTEDFQELRAEIQKERSKHREEIIAFLKEKPIWQEEWEANNE